MYTEPFHLKVDFQLTDKNICFLTTSNVNKISEMSSSQSIVIKLLQCRLLIPQFTESY